MPGSSDQGVNLIEISYMHFWYVVESGSSTTRGHWRLFKMSVKVSIIQIKHLFLDKPSQFFHLWTGVIHAKVCVSVSHSPRPCDLLPAVLNSIQYSGGNTP